MFPVCIMGEMWNLIYQLLVYISIIVVLIRELKKFILKIYPLGLKVPSNTRLPLIHTASLIKFPLSLHQLKSVSESAHLNKISTMLVFII